MNTQHAYLLFFVILNKITVAHDIIYVFSIYTTMTSSGYIGKRILRFDSIDSTNNYAIQLTGKNDTLEGDTVWALEQTAGKGHQGRRWESPRGENLTFSIIFFPRFLKAGMQFYLSKIVSLGVYEFLKEESPYVTIKWPNDLYHANKKIGGILIENGITGTEISYSVAGIGLNLNQKHFNIDAPNPVSLTQITHKHYDIEDVLKQLCLRIEERYEQLKSGNMTDIDRDYLNHLFQYKQLKKYRKGNRVFEARITTVREDGTMVMESPEGEKYTFGFKEFEYILDHTSE